MKKIEAFKFLYFSLILAFLIIACHTTKHTFAPPVSSEDDFYKKYSKILGVKLTGLEDKKFIEEVAGWMGTPYLYGGETTKGVDCSGFVKILYKDVYNLNLYRTAFDLTKNCDSVNKKDLKTGDLIFFKINSDKISHVGIYINDGKFIHASSAKGVIISDLNEAYYKKYFFSAGRLKNLK
ncbi:MAG: C40 family peptidase [Bacteroidales bacterium]|jgi:lipoprotein Spr